MQRQTSAGLKGATSTVLSADEETLIVAFRRHYPLGYVHIDLAEVWTEAGKL